MPRIIRPATVKPPEGARLNFGWGGVHTDGRKLGDILIGYWLANQRASPDFASTTWALRDLAEKRHPLNLRVVTFPGDAIQFSGGATSFGNIPSIAISVPFSIVIICTVQTSGMVFEHSQNANSNDGCYVYDTANSSLVNRNLATKAGSVATGWQVGCRSIAQTYLSGTSSNQLLYKNGRQILAVSGDAGTSTITNQFVVANRADGSLPCKMTFHALGIFNVVLSPQALIAWDAAPYPIGMFAQDAVNRWAATGAAGPVVATNARITRQSFEAAQESAFPPNNVRMTRQSAEVPLWRPFSADSVRLTRLSAEVAQLGADSGFPANHARMTQQTVEVLYLDTDADSSHDQDCFSRMRRQ